MMNPCYDLVTKTDCKDRKQGCAATCERWQAYEAERNRGYAKIKVYPEYTIGKYTAIRKWLRKSKKTNVTKSRSK